MNNSDSKARDSNTRVKLRGVAIASALTLFTLVFEAIIFGRYRAYLLENYSPSEWSTLELFYVLTMIAFYIASAFLLWAFFYLAIISPILVKPVFFVFFALTALYEFTYQSLFGRFSTVQDFNLAFMTTESQKLDAVASYLAPLSFLPIILFLIVLIFTRSEVRLSLIKSAVSLMTLALMITAFNFAMWSFAPRLYFFEGTTNSLVAGTRTISGSVFSKYLIAPTIRLRVPAIRNAEKPKNNVVLVIDESIRGDHLGLNGYDRSTSPTLERFEKAGLLKNWGIASSASTRSFESFQHIITGVSLDNSNDTLKDAARLPTLFQYAKAMNYKTYYLDGQLNEYWAGPASDVEFIDIHLGKKYFDPLRKDSWEIDSRIAEKLNEIIDGSLGNFVVVFKRGIHTPYSLNFPRTEARWKPSSEQPQNYIRNLNRQILINNYDNAIRFNLSKFFEKLAGGFESTLKNTVILYTSDHGQTLNENGERYSHGGDSQKEATVPLFMIGNVDSVDTEYPASHSNIFATMLDLMRFPSKKRGQRYAISLLKATKSDTVERYFVTPGKAPGDLSFSLNSKILFEESKASGDPADREHESPE